MPTIAEQLRQEGMQEGMQQGIQQGMEQGIQQGVQQGMQQGMQQGELHGKRKILLKLMDRKFSLTAADASLIHSVEDPALLDQALEAVLFAQGKDEILCLLG